MNNYIFVTSLFKLVSILNIYQNNILQLFFLNLQPWNYNI